jgi:serine phosphatase RsbU (regulator of sigma subunit)
MGVSDSASYRDNVIKLCPGDRFMFLTDGLTETGEPGNLQLGQAGVRELFTEGLQLSPHEHIAQVVHKVQQLRAPGDEKLQRALDLDDDLCFVIGRIR